MALLLLCTVGGTPEAIAASIKGLQPERVIFIVSPETESQVEKEVVPLLQREGITLTPGQYDMHRIPDAQDFPGCVEAMRALGPRVEGWVVRGEDYRAAADFTGGTKCMSSALALVASQWHCTFSYVGGTERTKDGVGVVVSGREKVLHSTNPWDSLGYRSVEEASLLFDKGDYEGAASTLDTARRRARRADVSRELSTLCQLCQAYLEWDSFRHRTARATLAKVLERANDLRHAFDSRAEGLLRVLREHLEFLGLFKEGAPGRHFIVDLLANARRCANRRRYDDAVARLYRAVEATAQLQLRERYGIGNTARASLDTLPEKVGEKWRERAQDGLLTLGLQDDYRLLQALDDALGKRFVELGLDDRERSPLMGRNSSILAHGFQPVEEKVYETLWEAALQLSGVEEEEVPLFPTLRGPE